MAFMLYGSARIPAIDAGGKSFVADVNEGDLWYFPTGIPHSIQGLGPDGAEFLLVFDDGNFSEYATVLLSEWMAHTPREVLAKNFGTTSQALARMPTEELFIFQSEVPPLLASDQVAAAGSLGPSPRILLFASRNSPSPSGQKEETCALSIPVSLKCRQRSRRRLLRCAREVWVNSTGIRTPTSGSTTSAARDE